MKKKAGLQKSIGIAAAAALTMLLVLLSGLSAAPDRNWDSWGRHEKQYEELTAALISGRLSLPEEPAAFLADMDNPYDPVARSIAGAEAEAYALIDTAYYKGKYYTYFGLTPALLLFLPFRLATGRLLPTWIAVILMSLLTVPVCFLFTEALRKRFFPSCGNAVALSLGCLLTGSLGLPYLAAFCTTYSMPAVTGLFLTLTGLTLFLAAERPDGSMRRSCLISGSIAFALTIGCRPSFAISFFLLFPIFGKAIRRGAFFRRSREALTNTVIVMLPALLLGSGFLIYNALRFDDPLEFGFHYLFTTSDLLHTRLSHAAALESGRLLFLQVPHLSTHFPFMVIDDYVGQYAGELYVEPLFGGLLPLHPVLPAGLLLLAVILTGTVLRKLPHPGRTAKDPAGAATAPLVLPFALVSLAAGVLILVLDSSIAGVSQRYESDFALFFFIPAAIAIFMVADRFCGSQVSALAGKKRFLKVLLLLALLILIAAEAALTFSSICCDGRYFAMRDWNPDVYNRIAHLF